MMWFITEFHAQLFQIGILYKMREFKYLEESAKC